MVKEFSSGKPAGAPARAVMAVPGLRIRFGKADKDPQKSGSRLPALGFRKPARESRV
jgi:hypothetical protein